MIARLKKKALPTSIAVPEAATPLSNDDEKCRMKNGSELRVVHRAVLIAISLLLGACATAPRVTPLAKATHNAPVIAYALPKSELGIALVGEMSKFKAGPLTSDLDEWTAERKKDNQACTASELRNEDNICFWNLRVSRRDTEGAAMSCATSPAYGIAGQGSLHFDTPPVITSTTWPDSSQLYAVHLEKPLFQSTELDMKLSASNTLTSFTAKATNDIAATVEKSLSGAVFARALHSSPEVATHGKLDWLIGRLKVLRAERRMAASLPDSNNALATIDAEIAATRALAEGTSKTVPFKLNLKFEPLSAPGCGDDDAATRCAIPATGSSNPLLKSNPLGCLKKSASLSAIVEVNSFPDSLAVAQAIADHMTKADGLRYRQPVEAGVVVRLTCVDSGGTCAPGVAFSAEGRFMIPQWGPTLALSRNVGWRSGSIAAGLDANTGALTSASATRQGGLLSGLVNEEFVQYKAGQESAAKAAQVDRERVSLERERALLEHQVKICEARRQLQLPVSKDCPP